jgi:hypothetical protein
VGTSETPALAVEIILLAQAGQKEPQKRIFTTIPNAKKNEVNHKKQF